jgi:ribose transport system substrate-binding protein
MTRTLATVSSVLAIGLAATGCGGSNSGSSGSTSSGTTAKAGPTTAMAQLLRGSGYTAPPTTGPKPQRGKTVWVLSCGQSVTNCSVAADAMVATGRRLGWKMNLVDTQFDPSKAAAAVRQAIAAKADGILTYIMDCPTVKNPLAQARAAGIKLVSAESLECQKPLYDSVVTYGQGPFEKWVYDYGAAQAQTIISGTNGHANVIGLEANDNPTGVAVYDGFEHGMKSCSGCKYTTVTFTNADVGPPLQQKVQQALVQHPDANSIVVPADAYFGLGALPALRSTGRLNKVFVGLGEGDPTVMAAIRKGTITKAAGVGIPEEWEAYAAVDNLNRIFAGGKPVASGIGLQAFTTEDNVSPSGPFRPTIDYKKAYRQSWGLQ